MNDDQVLALLRDVALPPDPADRLSGVRDRARRHRTQRTSAVATALAAVMVAGVVSAVTVDTTDDAVRLVDVARTTEEAGSFRVVVDLDPGVDTLGGLAGGTVIRTYGDVDVARERAVYRTEIVGPGGTVLGGAGMASALRSETRVIGDDVWVKQDLAAAIPSLGGVTGAQREQLDRLRAKPWLHVGAPGASEGVTGFVDLADLLARIRSGRPVRDLPAGEVAGVRVTRSVVLADSSLVGSGSYETSASLDGTDRTGADVLATEGRPEEQVEVELAVDGQGRLRQLRSTTGPAADFGFTLTVTEFGIPVDVSPPDPDEVVELAELGSAFAGAYGSELTITPDEPDQSGGPGACTLLKQFEEKAAQAPEGSEFPQEFRDALARECADEGGS